MEIEEQTFQLRPFREADEQAIVASLNDWAIAQWLTRPPFPYTVDDARWWIDFVRRDHEGPRPGHFAVADRSDGRAVGCMSLEIEEGGDSAELGYWMAKSHWGQGLATAVAGAVVDYGFDTLGLRRLFATTDPANAASQRVLRKCGFEQVGLRPLGQSSRRGSAHHILFERRAEVGQR